MKNKDKKQTKMSSALAITLGPSQAGPFKAVRISRTSRGPKLSFKMLSSSAQTDATTFVSDVTEANAKRSAAHPTVIGFDTSAVSFYRISVPPVKDSQVGSIVNIQAESLLPLPLDMMEIGFRAGSQADNRRQVTMAVARKDQLAATLKIAKDVSVRQVVLDAEATLAAWQSLFADAVEDAVLVDIRTNNSLVMYTSAGLLMQAAKIDVGSDDLSSPEDALSSASLFAHDMQNTLDMFEVDKSINVYVISPETDTYSLLLDSLNSASLKSSASVPSAEKLLADAALEIDEIIEYLVPIGTAIVALDFDAEPLDLFSELKPDKKVDTSAKSWEKLLTACAFLLMAAILLCLVAKTMDQRQLAKLQGAKDIDAIITKKKVIKLIAQKRLDVVGLITEIDAALPSEMKVKNLSIERGKPISFSSVASSDDQLLQLEENIAKIKGVSQVNRPSYSSDEKGQKKNFKITFHYKDFTKKASSL